MKKYPLMIASVLALALILAGCKTTTKATTKTSAKPYEEKVVLVNKQAKRIKSESDIKKQVASLKKFEEESNSYQQRKKTYKQVILAYQNNVKAIKQAIKTENLEKIKRERPTQSNEETQQTLEKKIARLTTMETDLMAQRKVVYTPAEFQKVTQKVETQIAANQSQIKSAVLSTNSAQKYVDAYHQFSLKGHPKGLQRGSSPREKGFYAAVGLSKKDYWETWGGIYDYYGNAVEKGWITQSESEKAYGEAQDKLLAGDYAKSPIDHHTMNFYQIESGDYSGLMGTWTEVAEGLNKSNGKGFQWRNGPSGKKLSISKSRLSDGTIVLSYKDSGESVLTEIDESGKTMNKPGPTEFVHNDSFTTGDSLSVDGPVGPDAVTIMFLPKGSNMKDWPGGVHTDKEHIWFRTSNMSFVEVFERE